MTTIKNEQHLLQEQSILFYCLIIFYSLSISLCVWWNTKEEMAAFENETLKAAIRTMNHESIHSHRAC